MPAGDTEVTTGLLKAASYKLAKLAVANDEHAVCWVQGNLFLDLERCGERLREHCHLIGDSIWQDVQVSGRQGQVFCEGAIACQDAKYCAVFAMSFLLCVASVAIAASCVDFADHPLAF